MRSWLGVVAAAVLLTGGGTAVAAETAAASPAASSSVSANPAARAAALAARLVAEMTFPAGTKPVRLHTVPAALRDVGPPGSHWVGAARLLVAPVKPAAVWAVVLSHKPFGSGGSMGAAGDNGPTGSDTMLPAPEPGIAAAVATVWLEPWHNGTLIAAYAYATWLPVRTAAEHVNPGSVRAVTVSATTIFPRQHTVTRTFTSAEVIGRIAAYLNARPAAPQLAIPCPLPATTYQATFVPRERGGQTVIASATGCLTDQITVNNVSQPLLWDIGDRLGTILGDLLGLAHAS
jgi:hypothetical protein